MTQTIKFRSPVRIGENVTAVVTAHTVDYEKNRVLAETVCRVGDRVVVEGSALFMTERRPVDRAAAKSNEAS